jgi:hypothetical protein
MTNTEIKFNELTSDKINSLFNAIIYTYGKLLSDFDDASMNILTHAF